MLSLSVSRFHSPSSALAISGPGDISLPGSLSFPVRSRQSGAWGSLRLLLALLATVASVLGLAGCGGGWGEFKPTITTQVQSQTVTVGATATFTVAATGTGPITYQWSENGTAIPGATGVSYTMTAQSSDNGAVFAAAATNAGGSSTSQGTLTVQVPPAITTQPASQTVAAGQTAAFSVTATGTGPLTYQWFQNGAPISGATASTYTAPATTPAGTSTITVAVSNIVGSANSAPATLTVNAIPALAFAPIAAQTYGSPAFPVSATSASPGAVTYAVTSGPATISGNVVTPTGVGTVVLSASQAASGTYAATTAAISFAVTPVVPALQFASIPAVTVGTPFTVSASSLSSGAVTYSVISGPATIAGASVTVTGQGTVVLGASQVASGNYAAATATTTVTPGAQTPNLVFGPIASQMVGAAPFAVSATSASAGAVSYSVVSGPATISGNTVTVTGAGTVVLGASQAAASGYNSATASTSFTVGTSSATLAFAPIAAQTFGNAPFPVSATSASPGTVTYAVVSGPATISGNTVTTTGIGTVTLSAAQAASGSYPATTANTTFTVSAATPTLAFAPIPSQTAGGAPFTVSATSVSSGAVTYKVISGPATISGNTVTVTGNGTVVLSATQAASGNYAAATVSTSFTAGAQSATLAFAPIPPQTYGNQPFAVSATSASPGAVTYAVVSGPATISGNTVTITGTGTVVLTANQTASGSYAASTANTTFSVAAATPTLAFAPIPAQTAGSAPFTISATSASTGAVTYAVVSGPATISGNTVTVTGSGTVVLSATQAASGNYASATASTNFTAGAQSATLAFAPIAAQTYGNPPFAVTATSASSGPVVYAVTSGPATISGNTVTLNGIGTVTLTATQAASGSYAAASPATATFAVAAATPNLVFATIALHSVGDPAFPVTATSASSGAVTYSVVSGPATIAGNLVTLTGLGNVVLAANQVAAGNYTAATANVTLAAGTLTPTLTFAPIGTHSYGDAPFPVSATSASSGAVTYNVISGPATISGNTVTVTGAGTVVLGASQSAAGGYVAANATATFNVGAEVPTLSFAPIATQTYGAAAFTVSATSASNGTVAYAVVSGPATVSGSTVTTTGIGTVILSASQAASGSYAPATATTNFNVGAATPTLAFAPITAHAYGDAPFTVSASSASSGAITYIVVSGPATISGSTVTLTGSGSVVLSANQAASGDYAAATAQATVTVAAATPTLTFAAIPQHTLGDAAFAVSATSASSGPVVYTVASGPATISGNTVTVTGTGTVTLTANQAASGSYAAATQATTSFTVVPAKPTLAFAPIAAQTFGGPPFSVSASSASTGAITYSVISGPATIAGQTVTVTADGSIILGATQAADANYTAASTSTIVNVGVATPNLQFAPIAAQTFGNAPFTVSASSASAGAVTYAVQSGPATISGNTVTITGAGTIVLTANQAQAPGYGAASVTASVSVAPEAATLAFAPIPAHTYGDAPFTVNASSASTGTVTYAVVSGPATISGNAVTITGTGNVVLSASQAATANYAASSATANFNVNAATPTLTFATIPAHMFGDAPFNVSATSASPGAVVYAVQSGPATISGNTVTLTGTGTVILTANQAASGSYAAAAQATASFAVTVATPTLTFSPVASHTFGDAPFTVTATSASSAPVVYAVASGPATISGNTVTLTGIGTVVLTANQAASGNYAAAAQASVSFPVIAATPTLTFASIANHTYGDPTFNVSATSASSGPVVYAVQSGPATISGSTVTLTGTGTVVLTANQAAFGNYGAAAQASTSFTVGAATPTLTFAAIPNHTYGDPAFPVSATSASTGPVVYAVQSGPATISNGTVTLTGVGTVVLTANQAAYGNYAASAQATTSFSVNAATPTLAFGPLANHTYGDAAFAVKATSPSTGPVVYAVQSGPATISNGTVTLTGVGTVVLTANQAAYGNYNAAAQATASFTVNPATPTLSFNAVPSHMYGDAAFGVTATSSSPGPIVYGVGSGPATISNGVVTLTGVGTVVLTANQAAYGNYSAAAQATTSFAVNPATPTLAFATIPNHTYGDPNFAVTASSASAGVITYAVQSGPATLVSGNTVQINGVGAVTLVATQAAAGNYAAASATATFTVAPEAAPITFNIPNQIYSTTPFTVAASSSSPGALTYGYVSGPATLSGNSVTMTGVGTVKLSVSQAASGNYAANSTTATFTISQATPTVSFSVPDQTYGAQPYTLSASSPSTGAFTYTVVSGPATIVNGTVKSTGIGTVKLMVSQAADPNYTAASATATFNVNPASPSITFNVANQQFSLTPVSVSAVSNSSGAFTYSVQSGPALMSGAQSVSLTGSGTVVLVASQAASGNYTAGTQTASFNVSAILPTLSLGIANQTYGAAPFSVSAVTNSLGTITYTVLSGPATVNGNIVTLTGIGTVQIQANVTALGGYTALSTTAAFTVAGQPPTIAFSVPNQNFSTTPFAVIATSTSPGAITYVINNGAASIAGSNLTMSGLGTVSITANQAASGTWAAGSATTTFTISPGSPSIHFSIPDQVYGSQSIPLAATSNSTGAFTYTVVSGPAVISPNNSLSLTGIGPVKVSVTQAAAGNYTSGTASTTFNVSAAAPSIVFNVPNQVYSPTPFQVNATSNSAGTLTYTVQSGPATIVNNTVALTGTGTVVLVASQAANGNYTAGTQTASFTVSSLAPTLTFNVPNHTYGDAAFTVSATSNSPGAITYSYVSGPATLTAPNTVTLTGVGTVQLLATQAASGGYAATTAPASFTVAGQVPKINFSVANQTFSTTAFPVNATSNSPGAFSYVINSGPATISGQNVTMTGVGTVNITANQAASGTWAAGNSTTTFTITQATPAISFVVPNQTYGAAPFGVTATSPSSGAYTYTVVSGPATVSGSTVTLTGAGMVTLKATQAAAGNYATNSAIASFNVAQNVSISPITPANQTFAPGQITFNATAVGGDTDNLTWSASGGSFTGSVWTSPNTAGTYNITATSVDDTTKSVTTTAVISAPVITKQPVSMNVCVGAQATLSVVANYGSTYQWLLNGTAISGANSSTYYLASAQAANAGTYTVQVSNPAGTATSNLATLGVGSSITNNPNNVTIYPTQTATFSVGVTGDGPFSYQWFQIPSGSTTGTAISGATSVSYTTPAVSSANNGTKYYVIVTDTCGTTMQSTSANLTVISGNAPPTITQQPSNVSTPIGGTPSFTVVAAGTNLTYQWYQIPAGSVQGTKVLVTGATSATYTLPATSTNATNDGDQYYVIVTNSYGQAVSFPATLTVGAGISITQQPQSVYINPGQPATFSVVATSTAPLSYQWYEAAPGSKNFNAITGATSSSYTFNSAAQTDSNTVFYVVVSNGGATSSVTSSSAAMFVTPLQGIPLCSQNWDTVGSTVAISSTAKSPDGNTYGKNCAWELTSSKQNQEGNIVWPTLISTGNIQLQFTIAVSNPSNPSADGFTMLLGDPSLGATPTSQGATGQGMGAEGIPGFVLAFDDYENPGDPTIPYLGVGRGETALWENPYAYTNTSIPALAQQNTTITHSYLVSIVQGYMTVSMDGNQVFSGQVSVPPVAYLYFTSSTGSYWESMVVSNVQATVSVP